MKFGSLGSGDGQFNQPRGVAVDASGSIYVVDSDNHRVQKFGPTGNFLTKWGQYGTGNGHFNMPTQIAIHPSTGNLYVVDYKNNRVEVFSAGVSTTGIAEDVGGARRMSPGFPNPFRSSTRVDYELDAAGPVRVQVFDVQGRVVRTLLDASYQDAGPGTVAWDGRDEWGLRSPAGVYYLRLVSSGESETRTISLLP
jgi:hypothetical protein